MALTLAEKAQRDIDRLRKTVAKLQPRHEKATAAIEKKRAAHEKRTRALELAEQKYALLDNRRVEAEKYIAALEAAIGTGSPVDVPDVEQFVADIEADDVEDENESDVVIL